MNEETAGWLREVDDRIASTRQDAFETLDQIVEAMDDDANRLTRVEWFIVGYSVWLAFLTCFVIWAVMR